MLLSNVVRTYLKTYKKLHIYLYSFLQSDNDEGFSVTSVLDLHFRKQAAENEMSLACKEAQELCDTTLGSIDYLRNIEFTQTKTEIGLRALVYEKVVALESLYDTYCILFQGLSITTHQLSNRISNSEKMDENNENFMDVLEYVDSCDD